jgi:hypothetical protein
MRDTFALRNVHTERESAAATSLKEDIMATNTPTDGWEELYRELGITPSTDELEQRMSRAEPQKLDWRTIPGLPTPPLPQGFGRLMSPMPQPIIVIGNPPATEVEEVK